MPVRYLVLCGGGSRGAIEAGFVQALWEHGIRFDGIVGSSVGALNGAFLAAGGHPDELAAIWRSLRFRDVFRFNRRILLRGLREASVFTLGRRLRRLLRDLGSGRFEGLPLPLAVVATDLATGEAVVLDRGPLEPALTASIAIPGLLPPVHLNGRYLVDGSLSADLPLGQAIERGATEIYAMRCACCASSGYDFGSIMGIIAQTFGMAVDRTRESCASPPDHVRTYIWSVDADLHAHSLNFSATSELVAAAYRETGSRLAALGFQTPGS
ncbi:MAG: patatin-like phospholipase family protein [Gemmatimonadetes bacterium]|nr:patatin-like phospholipase family protein [Gemmatimonadota bacterium]